MSNILFDLLLCGVVDICKTISRKAEKDKLKRSSEEDTSMTYLILDDFNRPVKMNIPDPPDEVNHFDDGGPDW
jgi:hypothetical protein